MGPAPELRVLDTDEELAREAADLLVWLGQQALQAHGVFRLVLAGGATPKALYRRLAGPDFRGQLEWPRVEFYFGDERCVPPDHPDSNYRMARETLLAPLGIDPSRVLRMPGEEPVPDHAAIRYEAVIRARFGTAAGAVPSFDAILLGLGEDGHTASLFPGTPAVEERVRLVVAGLAPREPRHRLTLTVPAINAARAVLFLVSGPAKAPAVRSVLEDGDSDARALPARLIQPAQGRLVWCLDRAAAAALTAVRQTVDDREE